MTPSPVPRAQLGEHQFWTDPILCKETQVRVGHLRSLSQQAPQEVERDARFEDDIGYHNYHLWAVNEINRNFTTQERQRVLGQSGNAVFEKHYQSQFIYRDPQAVVTPQVLQRRRLKI